MIEVIQHGMKFLVQDPEYVEVDGKRAIQGYYAVEGAFIPPFEYRGLFYTDDEERA